jgi:hypothetical protein
MIGAWIPISIFGLPFLGLLALSAIYEGGQPSAELDLISQLSGTVSPGAISRLSGPVSPGAIARLSAPRSVGPIANLSAGFYVSSLFGLPLLTRSQAPLETDDSLLTSDRNSAGAYRAPD